MENQQSTTKGFAILGLTNLLCKFLALIYLPLQTHILGIEGNSIAANGYKIYTFIFSLSNAGLPVAISKLVSEQNARKNYAGSEKILRCSFVVLISLGVFFAVFMATSAQWIAGKFCTQPDAYLMIIAISPAFLFTSVNCALRGFFQGRKNMMPTAVSQILEQVFNTVLTVVFAASLVKYGLKFGAAGTAFGTVAGALGASVFLIYIFSITKNQRKREIKLSRYSGPALTTADVYREILKYSLPAIINTVATCAPDLIDANSVLRQLQAGGLSYKTANFYNSIYSYQYERTFTLAIAFSTAIVTALIPALSSARAANNMSAVKRKISDGYKAIFLITVPSIAGITILAKPLLTFIFLDKNQGSYLLAAGAWTAVIFVIMSNQTAILISLGRPVVASLNLILGMVLKVLLNYSLLMVPNINIFGAIIGTTVGWVVACLLNQYAINVNIGSRVPYMRHLIKPVMASVVMGLAALITYKIFYIPLCMIIKPHSSLVNIILNDVAVLPAIAVAIPLYAAIIIKLHGVNSGEILNLPMGRRILRVINKVPSLKREIERT